MRFGRLRSAFLLALVLVASTLPFAVHARTFKTKASEAFLMDGETGAVLFVKDADKLVPPASLAKLMTIEVVFHAIKTGKLTLDDTFEVSEHAWRTGGAPSGTSTMFAKIHSRVSVADLIQGIIVQSANDGCITIAEGMSGSEEAFAKRMTERARALGLTKSGFGNATGLPDPDSRVSMRELALLARHLHDAYPDLYTYFAEPAFTWNNIRQRNRNPLLASDIGVDGLKTGYTDASGYAIVASMQRDGRRLYAAMSGMASKSERKDEARKLLEWGMRAFQKRLLFASDAVIGNAGVYGGTARALPLKAKHAINVLVPVASKDSLNARIVYRWPVKAPVRQGEQVGALRVFIGNTLSQQTPLYAATSVARGSIYKRALDAVQELVLSWL